MTSCISQVADLLITTARTQSDSDCNSSLGVATTAHNVLQPDYGDGNSSLGVAAKAYKLGRLRLTRSESRLLKKKKQYEITHGVTLDEMLMRIMTRKNTCHVLIVGLS